MFANSQTSDIKIVDGASSLSTTFVYDMGCT
uniref:Uncharacterized protein n=1 Tax=Anopheles dirus TaxID=7168 RepID=A0A182NW41_9DIPT